jgi:hypothetical protein
LLLQDLGHIADVEAQEVAQLGGGVDLRLVGRLRLPEHRRGVDRVAPRPGEEVGRAQEHRRALVPWRLRPGAMRAGRGLDRRVHLLGTPLVRLAEHVVTVVRRGHRPRRPPLHVAAADHQWQLRHLLAHGAQACLQPFPLRRARRVGVDRLVLRNRRM